jgi:hypothetical protein
MQNQEMQAPLENSFGGIQLLVLPNTDDIDKIREFAMLKAQQYSREVERSLRRERELMDSITSLRGENERLVLEKIENHRLCEAITRELNTSQDIAMNISRIERNLSEARQELSRRGLMFGSQLSSMESVLDVALLNAVVIRKENDYLQDKTEDIEKSLNDQRMALSNTEYELSCCRAELANSISANQELKDKVCLLEQEAVQFQLIRSQLEDSQERVLVLTGRLSYQSNMRADNERLKDEYALRIASAQHRHAARAARAADGRLCAARRALALDAAREWRRAADGRRRARGDAAAASLLAHLEAAVAALQQRLLDAAAGVARARAADRALLDQARPENRFEKIVKVLESSRKKKIRYL